MNIIKGRGNRRQVLSLPCAAIVKAAPEKDQQKAVAAVCEMLSMGVQGDQTDGK